MKMYMHILSLHTLYVSSFGFSKPAGKVNKIAHISTIDVFISCTRICQQIYFSANACMWIWVHLTCQKENMWACTLSTLGTNPNGSMYTLSMLLS